MQACTHPPKAPIPNLRRHNSGRMLLQGMKAWCSCAVILFGLGQRPPHIPSDGGNIKVLVLHQTIQCYTDMGSILRECPPLLKEARHDTGRFNFRTSVKHLQRKNCGAPPCTTSSARHPMRSAPTQTFDVIHTLPYCAEQPEGISYLQRNREASLLTTDTADGL